jgi:hypothetical protein
MAISSANILTVAFKILEHFPIQDLPPRRAEGDDQEQRANRLKQVQNGLIFQKPIPILDGEGQTSEVLNRPGELYMRCRTTGELPENARAFYKLAGAFPPRDL